MGCTNEKCKCVKIFDCVDVDSVTLKQKFHYLIYDFVSDVQTEDDICAWRYASNELCCCSRPFSVSVEHLSLKRYSTASALMSMLLIDTWTKAFREAHVKDRKNITENVKRVVAHYKTHVYNEKNWTKPKKKGTPFVKKSI